MKQINASTIRLLLISCALSLFNLKVFAQGFSWAQGIVSSSSSGIPSVSAIVIDKTNNGYFLGAFSGTADFDAGSGVQNLTAVGILDMHILKNDADGNFIWVKHVSGITSSALCTGRGIGLDSLGNIYVCGTFREDVDFDPGPGVYPLSSFGGYHTFVLKLDPTGNFIWVKDMGGQATTANLTMTDMKMDGAANIYFTCGYASNPPSIIDVDPGPNVVNILCPADGDILIEKLDSAGNFIWVKQISGPDSQIPYGLALDTLSDIYLSGYFKATTDFDPDLGVANLTSTNGYDAFIAKYDSSGNYLWAGQIGGSGGDDVGYGVAIDTFGNVVMTGYYAAGTTDFDPGITTHSITTTSRDMFVLKLRSDGSFGWVKSIHPGGNDVGIAIATDGLGNVYTTGEFFTGADFDPGAGEYWLYDGVYVQKLDSAGNFVWARVFDGEFPTAITLDHANDIYVVGRYSASGDFDPGPGVFTLPGGDAGFIEKLCGTALAITASDSTPCAGDNVQLTATVVTGATYTWTKNDTVIAGSGNTITISEPGVYEVYTDGGCPSASGPIYIIDCLGVGENITSADVEVYPNPTNDKLTIETTLANYLLTILNTLGQVVEQRAESENTVLDVSQYNSGIYYLQIKTTDGQVLNRKFVVQH